MKCPECGGKKHFKNGVYKIDGEKRGHRYVCSECGREFTDRTGVTGNVLAFSCPHLPFNHRDYLDFLRDIYDEYKCSRIICLGDLFDNHSISYHDTDPNGHSAEREFELAREEVKKWVKAFPEMTITLGNHDLLPVRKARTFQLPKSIIKSFNQIWDLPPTWEWVRDITINDVKYQHGNGKSGMYMHKQWAVDNMMSTVTGHGHSNFGVEFMASKRALLWGMGVGCGVDEGSYAMEYGKDFGRRPVIGCGVVTNEGKTPIAITMNM